MEATEYAVAHRAEAARLDAKELGIPVEVAARSLSRLKLTWKLNPEEMQKLVDYMYTHHMIRHDFNITRFILDVDRLCGNLEG